MSSEDSRTDDNDQHQQNSYMTNNNNTDAQDYGSWDASNMGHAPAANDNSGGYQGHMNHNNNHNSSSNNNQNNNHSNNNNNNNSYGDHGASGSPAIKEDGYVLLRVFYLLSVILRVFALQARERVSKRQRLETDARACARIHRSLTAT